MRLPKAPDLYAITDRALAGCSNDEQVRRLIDGGARLIQLRDKDATDAEFARSASHCLALCRKAGAMFIVNDRVEIAKTAGVGGVHVGQGDISPSEARTIMGPHAIVGISTHNRAQFHAALEEPVDYIALGPIFGTTTKLNADPAVGLELLKEAHEMMKHDGRPLVAIGGISEVNLATARNAAPLAYLAIIGGILKNGDIAENVRAFRAKTQCPISNL